MLVCGQCKGKRRVGNIVCWTCGGRGRIAPEPHPDTEDAIPSSEARPLHKDTPDSFWERMRMIHGDVGP